MGLPGSALLCSAGACLTSLQQPGLGLCSPETVVWIWHKYWILPLPPSSDCPAHGNVLPPSHSVPPFPCPKMAPHWSNLASAGPTHLVVLRCWSNAAPYIGLAPNAPTRMCLTTCLQQRRANAALGLCCQTCFSFGKHSICECPTNALRTICPLLLLFPCRASHC